MVDPLDQAAIPPRYDGGSIANLPASICSALGVPIGGLAPPLGAPSLPPALLDGVRVVVLLVVDGLGRWQLDAALASGQAPRLAALAEVGQPEVSLTTITSVLPASTVPALTTLNTGLSPARHGLIGWTLFLEEFGEVAASARWGPAAGSGSYLDERLGGHDPVAFFGQRTLHQRLAQAGVRATVVGPALQRRSGLSRMIYAGAEYRGYYTSSSLFTLVEQALAERSDGGRSYVYGYWDALDFVTHRRGPRGAEHREELAVVDFVLGRWLDRQARRGDLLFLLTADHGHCPTPAAQAVRLDDDRALTELLRAHPSGERRLVYLHARPGKEAALRDYCARSLGAVADVVASGEALERGWFGPGQAAATTRRRAGDVLLLARPGVQLITPNSEQAQDRVYLGNHGGLARPEMLVPLLAVRL